MARSAFNWEIHRRLVSVSMLRHCSWWRARACLYVCVCDAFRQFECIQFVFIYLKNNHLTSWQSVIKRKTKRARKEQEKWRKWGILIRGILDHIHSRDRSTTKSVAFYFNFVVTSALVFVFLFDLFAIASTTIKKKIFFKSVASYTCSAHHTHRVHSDIPSISIFVFNLSVKIRFFFCVFWVKSKKRNDFSRRSKVFDAESNRFVAFDVRVKFDFSFNFNLLEDENGLLC